MVGDQSFWRVFRNSQKTQVPGSMIIAWGLTTNE